MGKRVRFAINVDSGVVTYRNSATDALPTIWKLIDDETASAVVKRKVDAKAVIEAIQKSVVRNDGFNWKEYDAKRREELKLYNVSQREMIPDGGNADGETNDEAEREDGKVLGLKDLGLADNPTGRKGGRKDNPAKKTDKDAGDDNDDDGGENAGVGDINL